MDTITKRPLMEERELQEEGYLQEANRLFFHPLGLALAIGTTRPNAMADKIQEAIADLELADDLEGNYGALPKILERLRSVRDTLRTSDSTRSVNVLDGRDDPEGVIFDGLSDEEDLRKAMRVEYLWREREEPRRAALSFMVQPVDGLKTAADRIEDALKEINPLDLAKDEIRDVAVILAGRLGQ